MSLHTSHKQSDSPHGRTRVGNRVSLWLDGEVDGRSALARRFKEVFGEIAADLGGFDRMSEGQRQLARRCALLSVECERLEGQAVLGAEFDLDTYGQLTDRLGRAFQRLGMKRVPRDITPSLSQIVAKHKTTEKPAESQKPVAVASAQLAPKKPASEPRVEASPAVEPTESAAIDAGHAVAPVVEAAA
jgi:hypothetical protein